MREGFQTRVGDGRDPPADLLEAAVEESRRERDRVARDIARKVGAELDWREAIREERGTISRLPIHLQLRAKRQTKLVNLAGNGSSPRPIDPFSSSSAKEAATYSDGGLIPPGQALVIERAELRADISSSLKLEIPGLSRLLWVGKRRLDLSLVGERVIHHGQEKKLWLTGHQASAELILYGKLVDSDTVAGDGRGLFLEDEASGWLSTRPITLQVVTHADHQLRALALDGTRTRIPTLEPQPVWTDRERSIRAYYRFAGRIPPGKVYRLRRVEYRAHFFSDHPHGLTIRFRGRALAQSTPGGKSSASGTWEGDLRIEPGQESEFRLECLYATCGEAILYGAIEDA